MTRRKLAVWVLTAWLMLLWAAPVLAQQAEAPDVSERIALAQEYMDNGQWDFASYAWRQVLGLEPGNVTAHLGLVETLVHSGFVADAIIHLEALPPAARERRLQLRLAALYEQQKAPLQANRIYQAVLQATPLSYEALLGLSRLLPQLPAANQPAIRRQLQTQADWARSKAVTSLQAGRYGEADQHFRLALLMLRDPNTLNDAAMARFLTGQPKGAWQVLNQLGTQQRLTCEMQGNRAMVALGLGQVEVAQRQLQQAIGQCPNVRVRARLYNNLGYAYEQARRWTMASGAYQHAVGLDPGLTKAVLNLSYIYQRQNEYKQATKLLQQFVAGHPTEASAWNQLGFIQELDYHYKPAVAAYKKALALDPQMKDAYFNLATVLRKEGKMDEANTVLKQMTDLAFQAMEHPVSAPAPSSVSAPLFQVIDVFFTTPAQQSAMHK